MGLAGEHFASMWRFFLQRPYTRAWLCDPTGVPVSHASAHVRQPPVLLSAAAGAPALHTLYVLGHDGPVALGVLMDGGGGSARGAAPAHRTALAHLPGSDFLLVASFSWRPVSASLLVRFGVVAQPASGKAGLLPGGAPALTDDMACRWDLAREFFPPAARAVADAPQLPGEAVLGDAIFAPLGAFRDIALFDDDELGPRQPPPQQPAASVDASGLLDTMPSGVPEHHALSEMAQVGGNEMWKEPSPADANMNQYSQIEAALSFPEWAPPPAASAIPAAQIVLDGGNDAVLSVDSEELCAVLTRPCKPAATDTPVCVKELSFSASALSVALSDARGGDVTELSASPVSATALPPFDLDASSSTRSSPLLGVGAAGVMKKRKLRPAVTLECPTCGVHIRGKRGNLNRHIAARHERSRAFACAMPACGLAFQSKLNLVRHMTRVHEGRPHRCRQCPRGFRSAATLAKHARAAHAPRRGFVCARCAVCFGRRSVLDNHVARVHGEEGDGDDGRRFKCAAPKCGAAFRLWRELQSHELESHDGRVHQCTKCESVFETECKLSRHIRTDHGQTKNSCNCPVCGCVYSERSNLLRHVALAHKKYLMDEED